MDETDDAIRARLDAAASTVSAARSENLGDAIASFERTQRRRHRLAIVSALVLLVGVVAVGTAVARRSPAENDRLASGSQEEVMSYLSRSADKSLATNTFRYTTSYEASSADPGSRAYSDCAKGSAFNDRSTVSVDVKNDISVLLDPATGRPLVITSPAFDVVSSAAFPSVAITKPWVEYDRLDPQTLSAVVLMDGQLAQHLFFSGAQRQITPADRLAELKASATSVTTVGDEEIGGVMSKHLVMTMDPTKVEDAARQRDEAADAVARRRGHTPPSTTPLTSGQADATPIDVWVGTDDELIHKIAFTSVIDSTASEPDGSVPGGGSTKVTRIITFSDYGKPLPVNPPSRDETVALGSLPASALVGAVDPAEACSGLPSPTGTIDPATAKAVLECEQTVKRNAVAGRTVDQFLSDPNSGLPKDGVTTLDPLHASILDTSQCFAGLPSPDIPPASSGAPTSVIGPPCPLGKHEPTPSDSFPPPSAVGGVCIQEGDPDEETLKCIQDALSTMPSTTTDPNKPLAPQCAPPPESTP